tara:strand:- start:586 stop:1101 length:516 start_codon:yes stop_codon:yes gene_type:complete
MDKTTTLNISTCYDSQDAWSNYVDNINYLVNKLDVHCEISNTRLINIIEDEQSYLTDKYNYENSTIIKSKGYSKGDWQEYKLYYNNLESKGDRALFDDLIKLLKRSFTHFNDYYFELIECIEIEGKEYENTEPIEVGGFFIDWIEFPEDENILEAFNDNFGIRFDKVNIKE